MRSVQTGDSGGKRLPYLGIGVGKFRKSAIALWSRYAMKLRFR
ncbi:hypothetical protein [Moorena sp. SIO3I6]|nr:hypothetical protein [Moorena sp. SIO3I6]